jgi:indole-3-glycerol phosphate synthase
MEIDVLERIVATKRAEVARLASELPELERKAASAPSARDFRGALSRPTSLALISEVKRRSPGAGAIRPDLDPVGLASSYAAAGAAAISVLTDREYFQGSLADLTAIRASVRVPVLRKDFLISDAQIWEARAAGADAVLLIVRILEREALRGLRILAEDLGMSVLVEAHDAAELDRAVDSGASLVGINNRDLRDFSTRLETTLELIGRVPAGVTIVSESGIRTRGDVERLAAAGVDAVLVGEALLKDADPGAAARRLTGVGKAGSPAMRPARASSGP